MKKLIIIVLCSFFAGLVAPPVYAVDKKEKKATSKKISKPAKKSTLKTSKAKPTKKYDTFIDRNKNGIDDRKEKLRSKPTPKKAKAKPKAKPKAKVKKASSSKKKPK